MAFAVISSCEVIKLLLELCVEPTTPGKAPVTGGLRDRSISRAWSYHQLWMIAGRQSIDWSYDRSQDVTIDGTFGRRVHWLIVQSVAGGNDWSYHRTTAVTIYRIVRSVVGLNNWLHDRSLITTTSRTICYDGYCHQCSPIVGDQPDTDRSMRPPILEIVANIADRSHVGKIATNRKIQISYDLVWLWLKGNVELDKCLLA